MKIVRKVGLLDVTNNSSIQLIFTQNESRVYWILQSIGYFEVKQNNIQYNWELYHESISLQALCEEFNKLTNTLRTNNRFQVIHIHS